MITTNAQNPSGTLGFGKVTAETVISFGSNNNLKGPTGVLLIVLLANTPQIVLSFLYFTYNGVFTCMLLTHEWSGYARKRNPLRVTSPTASQRGTYRLQLPYRYGIPILIGSGVLHWLVSQSIFLARINVLDSSGVEIPVDEVSTCGYSPIAIIFVIIVGSLAALSGIIVGARRSVATMPLAGSCSAVISAACHPPERDEKPSLKPVMWGVVAKEDPNPSDEDIGHCTFTSFEVEPPTVGQVYAGRKIRSR